MQYNERNGKTKYSSYKIKRRRPPSEKKEKGKKT
jgi:hypothetical protein